MLVSENIYLRPIELKDLDFILKIENDENNWLISENDAPYSKKDIENYISSIEGLEKDKQYRWIVCRKLDNKAIGAIDLFEYDSTQKRAGVGIIINEEFRHQGHASESLKLICHYAFSDLGLIQLWANILENNLKSIRLFEKCDFLKSGVKKNWILDDTHWLDMYFYQILNKEKNS